MARSILFFLPLLLVSLLTGCRRDEDQEPLLTAKQQALVKELNSGLALPFSNHPLDLPDEELSFLDPLGQASIVGLGEATHGSKEFFEAKHRIFRYMVEHFGHRAFGFECDFAESLYLDAYITSGKGNLEQLMHNKMHFWTWKTTEVRALLEWMRQYNEGKAATEQIHLYGIDCQFTNLQADLLLPYFQRIAPDLYQRSKGILEVLQTTSNPEGITGDTYTLFQDSLSSIQTYLEHHQTLFVQESSLQEWQIAKQLVTTLQQALQVGQASRKNDQTVRDQYMAENALWLQAFTGQDSKISLWAHNFHIGSYYNQSTGSYLKAQLGEVYQSMGFAFATGSLMAVGNNSGLGAQTITQAPIESSINLLFHNAQQKNFAFHLRNLPPGSGWQEFLSGTNSILSIGAVYSGNPVDYYYFVPIGETFDWLIYFDTVRASEQLQ